jgi:hypothetical protein
VVRYRRHGTAYFPQLLGSSPRWMPIWSQSQIQNKFTTDGRSVSQSVCLSVRHSFIVQLVGRSVGLSVGLSVCRSVGLSVGRSVGRSVCRSVGQSLCLGTHRQLVITKQLLRADFSVSKLPKEFSEFYGTQGFRIKLTRFQQMSLFWVRLSHSAPSNPVACKF